MSKYHIYPIADENADAIRADNLLLATDDLQAALDAAALAPYAFGGAVMDTETGEIDFGAGFGVPLPEYTPDKF